MAARIDCPHCRGTGVNYIITHDGGRPHLHSLKCGVCGGDGTILDGDGRILDGDVARDIRSSAHAGELWPVLVPLGIFFLFFTFLLL